MSAPEDSDNNKPRASVPRTGTAQAIAKYIRETVEPFQADLLEWQSQARGTAAELRRSLRKPAGSVPSLWHIEVGDLPESLQGQSDAPTKAESAIHVALCLYATHQQSKPTAMHRVPDSSESTKRYGLGFAVRRLVQSQSIDLKQSPLIRRFNMAATADDPTELTNHLRGIISQLRTANIELDYGQLASDIYRWNFPEERNDVRLAWGRQLFGKLPEVQEAPTDASDSSESAAS